MEIIITALIGLISGAIGSLIAPWVNWRIEIKKENRERKRKIIHNLRNIFDEGKCVNTTEFINSQLYLEFRPYIQNNVVDIIENRRFYETKKLGLKDLNKSCYYCKLFKDEIDRVENSWGLSLDKIRTEIKHSKSKGIVFEVNESD